MFSMQPAYAKAAPNPQQTINIFDGQWASKMPGSLGDISAGAAALFEDPRVAWAIDNLASLGINTPGSSVLELGPLEGGHTYLLAKAGAASVTAVEAHSGAFLKCLIAKEILSIERVNFLYGDAVSFLRESSHQYDIGFACGFLYHMINPVELIALLAKRCRSLFLWTVCWDDNSGPQAGPAVGGRGPAFRVEYEGFIHTLHRHDYGAVSNITTFWGGPQSHAHWMEFSDIISALKFFGFAEILYEREMNHFGPAIKLVAKR